MCISCLCVLAAFPTPDTDLNPLASYQSTHHIHALVLPRFRMGSGPGQIPRCPGTRDARGGQHAMQVCETPSAANGIDPSFFCDGCGDHQTGRRWHCFLHHSDFCLSCRESCLQLGFCLSYDSAESCLQLGDRGSVGMGDRGSVGTRHHQQSPYVATESHCSTLTSSSFNPSESQWSSVEGSSVDPESPRFTESGDNTPITSRSFCTSISSVISAQSTAKASSNTHKMLSVSPPLSAAVSAASTIRERVVSAITGRTVLAPVATYVAVSNRKLITSPVIPGLEGVAGQKFVSTVSRRPEYPTAPAGRPF